MTATMFSPTTSHWTRSISLLKAEARMDAEHFQPHYDRMLDAIQETGKARRLGELLTYCKRGSQPEYVPDGDVLVINSQHVGPQLIDIAGAERTSEEFWQRKPGSRIRKYDVLMNSTGVGTIGRVNCTLHDQKAVVDNHVTIMRVKPDEVDPLYLSVYLNSHLGREQTYKWQSGSSGQLEIYPEEIKGFLVIVPSEHDQKAIAAQLQSAYDSMIAALKAASSATDAVLGFV